MGLFAQVIGTPRPVSEQRVYKAIDGYRLTAERLVRLHATVSCLPSGAIGEGSGAAGRQRGSCAMSEPTSHTEAAGDGVSDEEMVETVAAQTDSASENADTAGKDWNGDPSEAPAPDDRG